MAQADIQRLERMAKQGNTEASLILELMEKCKRIASGEDLDGITMAFGIRSERDHDEILAGVEEDMLNELLPTILKMTHAGAGANSFFEGLSFHLSVQQRIDVAMFTYHRWNGEWPTMVTLSSQWKPALQGASTYAYRDGGEDHEVKLKYIKLSNREKIICS